MQTQGKPEQGRQFRKSGCSLSEFPVIKLHIFSDIVLLDLSDNLISDLQSLTLHAQTAPHALGRLKTVNLANNQFPNAQALMPLGRAARGISMLDISGNPLAHTLNFMYELALGFEAVSVVRCEWEAEIDEGVRQAVVRQQMAAGGIIDQFLHAVERSVGRLKDGALLREEKELIQGLMGELDQMPLQIPQQNDLIFQAMHRFITFNSAQATTSPSPTYRSPLKHASRQIETHSQYQISSPNGLIRYLSEPDQHHPSLGVFYYQQLVQRQSIGGKILQELQVDQAEMLDIEEGRRAITPPELLAEIGRKWKQQFLFTTQVRPMSLQNASHVQSPFKSVQTDVTTHARIQSSPTGQMYFGFDREWTRETVQFFRHRLQSLLRIIHQVRPRLIQSQEKHVPQLTTLQTQFSSPQQPLLLPSTFTTRDANYQTFGPSSFQASPLPHSPSLTLLSPKSPKSRNKFIIGSLVNVLELILKRIVLRRLRSARLIHPLEVELFSQAVDRVARRSQQMALRRIFQVALYYRCLQQKMDHYKLKAVFKAWRAIKRRKAKLLKTLLLRKSKKEKALLSVFLTQMRVNSRNIGLQRRMMRSKEELLANNQLEDLSCILKRSATCQKMTTTHQQSRPKDSDRTIQARRNFLKRTK